MNKRRTRRPYDQRLPNNLWIYKHLPTLSAFLKDKGAEVTNNLRRYYVFQAGDDDDTRKRYRRPVATLTLGADGKLTADDLAYLPDEATAAAIAKEAASAPWPKPVTTTIARVDKLARDLDVHPTTLFPIRDQAKRDRVIYVRQRIDKETGGKIVIPWTLMSDDQWQPVEPHGQPLPFWKPKKWRHNCVMIHEGEKAAAFVDQLCNDQLSKWREAREAHPWGKDLAWFEHWGLTTGALSAHRADYDELRRAVDPGDIVVVACDNDRVGIRVAATVAKCFGGRTFMLQYDQRFKEHYDLADPMPATLFDQHGRYIGPSFGDLLRPATWATKQIPTTGKGRPAYTLREGFANQWTFAIPPDVYINQHQPDRMLSEDEFNKAVRPFSDVEDTARLLRQRLDARVDGIDYDPGFGTGRIIKNKQVLFNTYQPPDIEPINGDITPWLEFNEYLLPNPEEREHWYDWFATHVARPGVHMSYGVLMTSLMHGVGKSTCGNVLARLTGERNCSFPNEAEVVDSNFTAWQANVRLAVINEIYAGTSKKAYNKMKSIIAEAKLRVHLKFKNAYDVDNHLHVFACSNSPHALHLDNKDRRWLVLRATNEKKAPELKYFENFYAWLDADGLGIIKHWAEQRGQYITRGKHAPMTAAKADMILHGMSEGNQIAHDLAKAALAYGKDVILVVEEVRRYVAAQRTLSIGHDHVEKATTLRQTMLDAGMIDPDLRNNQVARFSVNITDYYSNSWNKKVEDRHSTKCKTAIVATFPITADMTWAALKDKHISPHTLMAADDELGNDQPADDEPGSDQPADDQPASKLPLA